MVAYIKIKREREENLSVIWNEENKSQRLWVCMKVTLSQ